jgi:Na+-translocating ferredoxin:NAD+ oxidoreductase RnfC subunit
MYDGRRTPIQRLITKLGLRPFRNEGALRETVVETDLVRLPLKQHAGAPSVPIVHMGEKVKEGDPVALPPPGQLGAVVHASIPGTVTDVTDTIEIRR